MRFAALVALAVVASTAPALAAPAPYSPRWVASKRDTASTDVNTVVDTDTVPFRIGTVILPHVNDTVTSKRDATSDFVDAIEAVLNELPAERKRDVTASITAALQTLLDEAGSVLSDVKRDSASSAQAESIASESSLFSLLEERSVKTSTGATTWLKSLGNIASIGLNANTIANAVDGSDSTKRDFIQTSDEIDIAGALGGTTPQFEDRSVTSGLSKLAGLASVGGAVASVLSGLDGSSNSNKRDLGIPELPPSATTADGSPSNNQSSTPLIPFTFETSERPPVLGERSIVTLLKSLGNIASIGLNANTIANAIDGSDSTKRDFIQTSDEIDTAGALGGATPQFEDRSVASALSKLASLASVGGAAASVVSFFDESSNSMRRDLGMDSNHDQKRDISSDVESILQQIIAVYEGAMNGSSSASASTKRSTSDIPVLGLTDIITPEEFEELLGGSYYA